LHDCPIQEEMWFYTVLKMRRPEHSRSSLTHPFSWARKNSSNRTTYSTPV